jgi:glycosyltransferase involved in cell wall biosynthesis
VHGSRAITGGGAARAAHRLHQALVGEGVASRMVVDLAGDPEWRVVAPSSPVADIKARLMSKVETAVTRAQRTQNEDMHSTSVVPGSARRRLIGSGADVINLHWTAAGFLSVEQLGRLPLPVVWTLHDMWAFCGAEHVGELGSDARWRSGYRRSNRRMGDTGIDLDRWTWERKLAAWRRPYQLVAPSSWLAGCVADSALLSSWPVEVIPNALPTDRLQPRPRSLARAVLDLPPDVPLVLFGSHGEGGSRPSKGRDLLMDALPRLRELNPAVELVVLGQREPRDVPASRMPIHWLGHLGDEVSLGLVYSAVDVTVVPSRRDNLPQLATESQACGTPVVAFAVCGLPDAVADRETGYLAAPFDPDDLAHGVAWVLQDDERAGRLALAARERAVRLWSPPVVAIRYLDLYRRVIEDQTRDRPPAM